MKTWNCICAIVSYALLFFTLITCDDGKNNNEIQTNNYIITFDPDNGSDNTTIIVLENNKVSKPENPRKYLSGLFEGTLNNIPEYIFNGWYNDNIIWNFDTIITENITLKAKWITPVFTPIILTGTDDFLTQAVTYVNDNICTDGYTLFLDNDISSSNTQKIEKDVKLTIIGINSERKIIYTNNEGKYYSRFFEISGSIEIGENITIICHDNYYLIDYAIDLLYTFSSTTTPCKITLKNGSKVTRINNYGNLIIEGGEITEVQLRAGTFFMTGGRFVEDSYLYEGIEYPLETILLISAPLKQYNPSTYISGNAEIGNIYLDNRQTDPKINIASNNINVKGNISLGWGNDINTWKNKTIFIASDGYIFSNNDITKFSLGNYYIENQLKSLSESYMLEIDIINNEIKLVSK